jgi:pimeloyl-ACP methyl ester carboxylesterase
MTAESTPDPAAPDTIVLIHGLWMTPRSWEKWVQYYEGRGYRVLAPAYPGLEVEVEALREDPSPIEALTVPAIVEHLENLVGELDSPPIIMGHSMGGLLTQILLDHGFGAAGVAIDSVPAEGIKVVPVSQIRSLFPILRHPADRHKAVGFTPSSSTTPSPTPSLRRSLRKSTNATTFPRRAISCGAGSRPTSPRATRTPTSTSGIRIGRLCCS